MTAVLALGSFTSAGLPGAEGTFLTYDPESPTADIETLSDLLCEQIRSHSKVLVLIPSWRPEPATRLLNTAKSVLETNGVAVGLSELPPLALWVLGHQLAALAHRGVPLGSLVSAIPFLGDQMTVAAWLDSVANLSDPAPNLKQHVRSWLPGQGFAVIVKPEPLVMAIKKSATPPQLPLQPLPQPSAIAIADGGGDADWLRSTAVPLLGAKDVMSIRPSSLSEHRWGTARFVEMVGYSVDLAGLESAIAATFPCLPCVWCGELAHGTTCPWCGHSRLEPAGTPA
ncbi:MAG TPA: hypothetical protein VF942_15720 [Acidimicrobiales bacterium]